MSETTSDEALDAFLSLCGSCDAGLPMGCTCPKVDARIVVLDLRSERDAARAENDRLRGVVKGVQSGLAEVLDDWTPYDTRDIGEAFLADSVRDLIADILAALASVPSCGDPR
jgi:hypothetical protein